MCWRVGGSRPYPFSWASTYFMVNQMAIIDWEFDEEAYEDQKKEEGAGSGN